EVAFRKLLIVGTGALCVSLLPFWANWLRELHPEVQPRLVLTPRVLTFVSTAALRALRYAPVECDVWRVGQVHPKHVEYAEWPDAILVYPASAAYISRFARGTLDSPTQLAVQLFAGPIAIAPSLPPGAQHSRMIQRQLADSAEDPRVTVAATVP